MKKAICFVIFAILFGCAAASAVASELALGVRFDVEKLSPNRKSSDTTIVAFLPSLTYDCDYASMLTQSFYYYFDRGMAFDPNGKIPATRIFLVVGDRRNEVKSAQNIIGGMNVIYDESEELFTHFGVEIPYGKNAGSTVLLLDSNEKIVHIDPAYRAQGVRLKQLEGKVKEVTGSAPKVNASVRVKPLRIGDKAPDFLIQDGRKLSDLRGEVVLVSFYPAAFSGTFPKPYNFEEIEKTANKQGEIPTFGGVPPGFVISEEPRPGLRPFSFRTEPAMSCFTQIVKLDLKPAAGVKTAKRILVTSSTAALLREWQKAIDTSNIIYANDPDYSVSKHYSSYSPYGFNNRVSVIVDQRGRVTYIDESFEAADEAVIEGKINDLLGGGKRSKR